ncbi:MAG TPA: Ig-like domain-containing protein [Gemmatimonadales bacterium]
MRHFHCTALAAASGVLVACGGDDLVLPSEGEPASITIVQGDSLSGRVGEALTEPLIVKVLDGAGRPVGSATVVVEMSGASANPDTLSTSAEGLDSAEITLGNQVGEAVGIVRVIEPESPVEVEATFTVLAVAASANGLAGVSGDDQSAPAGTVLPAPLVVKVSDHLGNPVPGVPITWTPEGGGSVSASSTVTDAEGLSSVTRTLGPTAGPQTTLASSDEPLAGSPVVFDHTAMPGNAAGVQIVSGNNQSAPPRTTLPEALVVRVVDGDGNPIPSAAVTWVVTAGGGSVDPTTGTTSTDGVTSTSWTLGSSTGTNTVQAIVSGVGQAEFTAHAGAGGASDIRIVSGDNQSGAAGSALPAQLVVVVVDANDTPVPGATVTWSVESGGGSVSPASGGTDAAGRAATTWTLGPGTGNQRVRASASGAGLVQFSARATAGAAAALQLVTQPSGTAEAGVPFGQQPVVQVVDASGNPVATPGIGVTAAVNSGPGQIGGSVNQATDGNGRATFTDLEIGGATGSHTLIFAAGGFQSATSNAISVGPAATSTAIVSDDPEPSTVGASVLVSFQVSSPGGSPVGTVVVTASGESTSCSDELAPEDSGAGSCSIPLGVAGDQTLTATFQGPLFQTSAGTASHTVQP